MQAGLVKRGHCRGLDFVFSVTKRWKADTSSRLRAWAPTNLDLPGTMHIENCRLDVAVRTAALIRAVTRSIVL